MKKSIHQSVLLSEVVEALCAANGGSFLDCTLGGAGHTQGVLKANPVNKVTAIDRDQRAHERLSENLGAELAGRVKALHGSFAEINSLVAGETFDGVLADLGLSTDQIKEQRGFSFNDEAPLDMRMDQTRGQSASELIAGSSEQELYVVLRRGGVGNEARAIARAMITARPFATAKALAQVVARFANHKKNINPATLVFQALRMAVNDEISQIEALMEVAPKVTKQGGRLAVITFHSLEDKAVMQKMRQWEGADAPPANWPGAVRTKILGRVVTRKPIVPSEEELQLNPSARSARLRVFEFAKV